VNGKRLVCGGERCQGDVWAESSVFGFRWRYYACMDGDVFNITEWASCQVR